MNPMMEETGYESGSIAMSMNGVPKKPIPVSGDYDVDEKDHSSLRNKAPSADCLSTLDVPSHKRLSAYIKVVRSTSE